MGKLEQVDVCVVGSGAGGAVVACELAQAGVEVLLLERGRRFEAPRDYLATHPDWELRRSPIWQSTSGYPLTDGPLQRLDPRFKHLVPERADTVLPGSLARQAARAQRGPQALQIVFGVGGTTVLAAGQATRYGDETFRAGSIEGIGQDWPISYRELEPDYAAIEDVLGVAGDPALPGPERRGPYPHPPHALSGASQVVARGCEKLGLHLYPQAVAAPTRPHRGRPACRACCASCMLGCPSGAKGSADVCFIRPALATGKFELRTSACCLRLEPAPGKLCRVVYAGEAGSEQAVEARVVVLAAGAIETPRILLSSACGRWPRGAANGSDQVGRNYQETLVAVSWGLSAEPIRSFTGLAVDNVVPDFARTPGHGRWARGYTVSVAAAGMNLLGPVAYALQLAPGWGERHAAFMREFFGRALVVQAAGEQLASPDNRVDLDPRAKDCRGRPKTRVVNRLGDNDLKMLAGMVSTLGDILRASGAKDIHHDNSSYISRMGVEPRGTCRMGLDPAASVVDGFGASHEIGNLYIADASVLVGGLHGNISLTIQALARRSARAILRKLAG